MTTLKPVRKAAAPAKRAMRAKAMPFKPTAAIATKAVSEEPSKDKAKLVRDSFTIPKLEYAVIEQLKVRATGLKRPTKKSEMLRAGIAALQTMTDKAFLATLNRIPSLKTGRPVGQDALPQAIKKASK